MPEGEGNRQALTSRAVSGVSLTILGQVVQFCVQMGVLAFLARLLGPSDFGVMSVAMVVIGFCNLFVNLGLGAALVQRVEIDRDHVSAAFTLSILMGIVMAAVIALAAPMIAAAFRMGQLVGVLRVLAIGFVIVQPGAIATSLLARRLRFGLLAMVGSLSYLVGYGVVGLTLAALSFGVWALVFAFLAQMTCVTIFALVAEKPRLRFTTRVKAFRDLVGFGTGNTLAGVAGYFAENVDNMVVGRLLGAEALGYYGRAFQFLAYPVQWLTMVSDRVLFPLLSRIQLESKRLSQAYSKALGLLSLAGIPLTVSLAILAPEIVHVVLGPKWISVILPLQILSLAAVPRVVGKLAKTTARATGRVYPSAWRQGLFAILVVAGAWLGSYRGLAGVAAGVVVASFLSSVTMAHLALKSTGLSWPAFLGAHRAGCIAGISWLVVGFPVAYGLRLVQVPDIVVLVSVVAVMMATSLLLLAWCPQVVVGREGLEVLVMLRSEVKGWFRTLFASRRKSCSKDTRLRIVFTAPRFHTNQRSVVAALRDNGCEVAFLALYEGPTEDHSDLEPTVLGDGLPFRWLLKFLYKVGRVSCSSERDFRIRWGCPPVIRLWRELRAARPNAVVVRLASLPMAALCIIFSRLLSARVVIYSQAPLHGKCSWRRRFFSWMFYPSRWITPVLGNPEQFTRWSSRAYYVPFVAKPLTSMEEKLAYKRTSKTEGTKVLCIGKFVPRKNLDMMVDVFDRMARDRPIRLTIVGECSSSLHREVMEKLRVRVLESPFADSIELRANVPFDEMQAIYQCHDVFVLPSTKEAAAVSVLEAMSNGLAVISSDSNGTSCYLERGGNGHLFSDGDAEALAEALASILDTPGAIEAMGARSLELVAERHGAEGFYRGMMSAIAGGYSAECVRHEWHSTDV